MLLSEKLRDEYDYVIIGSGFGGSVSAYRLTQKGYKVLVIEKGKQYHAHNMPESNRDLKRWIWAPAIGLQGIMKMTFFRHVMALSGVGVGGGSLVYGATLPTPKPQYFETGSWAGLKDWQEALKPHYATALKMLGATNNPHLTEADLVMQKLSKKLGREEEFSTARAGIFFSEPGEEGNVVDDPYFGGKGPARKGCIECGGCLSGCRHNAKNSLDKNYLYLARQAGADIIAQTEVVDVSPIGTVGGEQGYTIKTRPLLGNDKSYPAIWTKGVIFSGGVLGTVPLLLKLKASGSLSRLSERVGFDIRTNSETLTAVTSANEDADFAQGIGIGSILNTDDHSHVEPINYSPKSDFWRWILTPQTIAKTFPGRMAQLAKALVTEPRQYMKHLFSKNWGKRTFYLLFMQHLDGTLTMKRNRLGFVTTGLGEGAAPSCYIPESQRISESVSELVNGRITRPANEAFLGAPSTAHVLGGAVIGEDASKGVIDEHNRVFGYQNMYVCDGAAISANPGVNPSLSITALTEWAMSHIPKKELSQIPNQPVEVKHKNLEVHVASTSLV
ncbi:GMC oxidoreductase [Sessilibacter corallicola]|uniref:Cholesterol oxidase n=1 Tax=Sessilibacter corallicola TaxID=2904075 RepID=A0ABQ0A8Z2_9GAMM